MYIKLCFLFFVGLHLIRDSGQQPSTTTFVDRVWFCAKAKSSSDKGKITSGEFLFSIRFSEDRGGKGKRFEFKDFRAVAPEMPTYQGRWTLEQGTLTLFPDASSNKMNKSYQISTVGDPNFMRWTLRQGYRATTYYMVLGN